MITEYKLLQINSWKGTEEQLTELAKEDWRVVAMCTDRSSWYFTLERTRFQ